MPLSLDAPNLSHEKCVRLQAFPGFCEQFPGASSSFPSEAGLNDVLVDVLGESCDGDAEDELDYPGTTIGTKFCVLHKMFFPCLVHRGCLPLTRS